MLRSPNIAHDTSGINTGGIVQVSTGSMSPPQFTPRRERTRDRLIEVAAAAFAEAGIEATSLRDIAARAGLTKGAIYGIFDGKDDLVLAVVRARLPQRQPVFKRGPPLREQLAIFAESIIAISPALHAQSKLSIEFELYLMTHPDLRRRMGGGYSKGHERLEEELHGAFDPNELPLDPRGFAILLSCLAGGVIHRRAVIPDVMTDQLVVDMFMALAPPDDRRAGDVGA